MKRLVILAILIIPFVGILLLRSGKHNVSTVPYFGPREEVQNVDGTVDTIYHTVPAFSFDGHTGNTITNKDFEGSIYVADFIFTTCQSICPKMSTELMRVQNKYKENNEVKFLTHTVNPEHDSVEVLREYAKQYGAMDNKWFFVTGKKEELYNIALKGYFLMAGEDGTEDHPFIHSQNLILVDEEGHLRGIYDGTDVFQVNDLIQDIKALRYELRQKEKRDGE